MDNSEHLNDIIDRQSGSTSLQIVFSDIVGFSKRKTSIQKSIINKFTELNEKALEEVSKKYIKYAQQNKLNFSTDIIKIPTGDGLALVIPFNSLETFHLDFALELLKLIQENNQTNACNRFEESKWCNCHNSFNVRIGITEGKGIIYKDINSNYNAVGNILNYASRVMDFGDEKTILLSSDAYENIIDMSQDVHIDDYFNYYADLKIKHGESIDIYQYIPKLEYVSSEIPKNIKKAIQSKEIEEITKTLVPFKGNSITSKEMYNKMADLFETYSQFAPLFSILPTDASSEDSFKKMASFLRHKVDEEIDDDES